MKARNRNKARKAARQVEAIGRKALYDQLTPDQKIERAQSRRGESARELQRLGVFDAA